MVCRRVWAAETTAMELKGNYQMLFVASCAIDVGLTCTCLQLTEGVALDLRCLVLVYVYL
jgi:hypothetical protein